MTTREQELNKYLMRIAENLDITDTMMEKAVKSYQSVGKWLGDCDENSSVKIMPQGSINLGTVVRPISDADEYDVDLVCLLKDGHLMSESEIKETVGNRLKENALYESKLQEEGKRCWTLQYDEFHMDILPSVPKQKLFCEPILTGIRLTHKEENGQYSPRYSNPYQYHSWFEKRMAIMLNEAKMQFAARAQVEIDRVPTYRVKTPLQRTIQLLKRHRDIVFKKNGENAPISIIITTLAAQAYQNETTVYEALSSILNGMESHIEVRNGQYWIPNPAMPEENFADKWNIRKDKHDAFVGWLSRAKQEILTKPQKTYGLGELSDTYQLCFGENIVKRSFSEIAEEMKSARDDKNLYVVGLTGGLSQTASASAKKVGGHNFFGK